MARAAMGWRAAVNLLKLGARQLGTEFDMAWRVGVDIGGTFTDVALVDDASGAIGVAKVPTTPRNLAEGVLAGPSQRHAALRPEAGRGGAARACHHGRHQRHPGGARRPRRAHHHARLPRRAGAAALRPRRPLRPVPGCAGRSHPAPPPLRDHRAHRRRRRSRHAAGRGRDRCADRRTQGRARRGAWPSPCCSASSTPSTSAGWAQRLRAALPGIPIYLSCEVLPEIKEFERTSTTAVCAYVGPILASYLARPGGDDARPGPAAALRHGLQRRHPGSRRGRGHAGDGRRIGPGRRRGGGGPRRAADRPRQPPLLRHGRHHRQGQPDPRRPVRDHARVRGRRRLQRQPLDARHRPSDPRLRHRPGGGVGRRRLDRLGRSRRQRCASGPRAPAPIPGPVCYGRGGTEPTVTDCDLLLGYLDKGSLLAGDLPIDHAAAEAAIRRAPGRAARRGCRARRRPPSSTSSTTPWREALKIVSVQRGHDPREFVLAAFGGAGPLHAAALADELGIGRDRSARRSPAPSRRSAWSARDLKRDYVRTVYVTTASADPAALEAAFAELETAGRRHARPRRRRARRTAASSASSMRATSASPTSCPCRCRRARSMPPSSPRSPRPSTPAIAPPTATTTAASRCSSSACASPPSARFRR